MKKNVKIFSIITVALLLICATIGFTVMANDGESAPAPTVEIYKKNIFYDDVIQLTYALKVDGMTDGQKVQILFGESAFEIGSATNTADVAGLSYIKDQKPGNEITIGEATYPVIFSAGISAGKMTTDVYAVPVIVDAEGNIVASGSCVEYSLYDYAMDRFYKGTPTSDQKALYKALLDYGAAVQDLFLPEGQTTPADGWADRYCRVVFCDTMLADDGTFQKGYDKNHKEQFTRPGEVVTLTASATDKEGHAFQGIYYGGELVGSEMTYDFSKYSADFSYVMAAYKHEYTEETANAKYLASTANLSSPALFYTICACGEISSETFEYGTAIPAFTAGGGAYFNNPGSYNYFGTKIDYSETPTIVKTSAAAPSVSNGVLTAKLGAWAHFQVVNTAIIEGTKHIVETDIKFSDIVKGTGTNTRFANLALTANSTSGSAANSFLSFFLNLVTDSNGNPIGVEMSTDEGIHKAGYTYTTFDINEWYNIRFEATEISETATAVEVYINGVHISDYDTIKTTNNKAPSGKINGFAIENRGTPENHAATVTLDNTFIGTYDPNHTHEYTFEIVSAQTLASEASASAPASYYKTCSCGAVSDTEVFYDGIPTYVAGEGAFYKADNKDYFITKNTWDSITTADYAVRSGSTAPTADGKLTVPFNTYGWTMLKNTNTIITGTKHIVETNIMIDPVTISDSNTRFGCFTVTANADNAAQGNAFVQLYLHSYILDGKQVIELSGDSGTKGATGYTVAVLNPSEWYTLTLVINETVNESGVTTAVSYDAYINGELVCENRTKGTNAAVAAQKITGIGFEVRGNTATTDKVYLDNTVFGTYAPFVAGTGALYNGSVAGSRYDYDVLEGFAGQDSTKATVNVTHDAVAGNVSLDTTKSPWQPNYTPTAEKLTGNSFAFEADIYISDFTITSTTDKRLAYIGFSNLGATCDNSRQFAGLNLMMNTTDGKINYLYFDESTSKVKLHTNTWYNLRIVTKDDTTKDDASTLVDIYLNGVLVAENIASTCGSNAKSGNNTSLTGFTWQFRTQPGQPTDGTATVTIDNVYIGCVDAE